MNRSAIHQDTTSRSRYPIPQAGWFGLFRFRSPLLTESLCFLFLRVLRCFTSPGVALKPYVFRLQCAGITRHGLPHSETPGSKRACRSPGLIAACYVLHRLLMPRHPLRALLRLIKNLIKPCIYARPTCYLDKSCFPILYAIVKDQISTRWPEDRGMKLEN